MEMPDSVQVFSDKYLENISDAFKTLYNEEQLSDVTIYCKGGSLKAHKLILAASSPYFCKIFRENRNEFPIIILHGTSVNQMKNLIELLYSGVTDVKNNDLESLYTLVREFEIKGVSFGPKSSSSNVRLEMNSNNVSPEGLHNRDTRFKGQKRVAVDYVQDENSRTHLPSTTGADHIECHLSKKANLESIHIEEPVYVKREIASPAPTESTIFSSSDTTSVSDRSMHIVHSENKLTAWAKKQRKFKCDLCPSSFKRSSHLSRHQLVHTGERPYSCSRCEKSFSRHDKLKNHERKAHEFIPDSMYERIDTDPVDSDVESNNINYANPNHNGSENSLKTEHSDLSTPKSFQREASPLFTISHISSILEDSFVSPPKKGRGRPRKYPPPTASPAVLNSNQELPVSNDMKASEKVENSDIIENREKVRKERKRRSWVDTFVEDYENNTTSRRLREKRNINNNEDYMFTRMAEEERLEKGKGLFCQICDKPFTYKGRLKLHMRKIHGIIDNSQEEGSNSGDAQKDNPGIISPPDRAERETLLTISSVCSLNESEKEKFEGKIMEKEHNLETNNPHKSKEENLTYEQLRELLPKECTLQPIVDVTDATQSNIEGKDCSQPPSTKTNDHDAKNLPQGPHMFVISSLLQGDAIRPTEKKQNYQVSSNYAITDDQKESQESKEFKIRKKKRKRGIKYARAKKIKSRSDQPTFEYQGVELLANTSNNVMGSSVSNIEATTSLNMGSQSSSFKFPQLSSAIEISIVPPNEIDLSTMIPTKKNTAEDLSITVIDSSAEKSQQDKIFADCNLSNPSDVIPDKPNNLLVEENNPHSQSSNPESRNSNLLLQCNPQVSQTIVLAQDPHLPKSSQDNLSFPQKRKRGRPRKQKLVPIVPIVKRGRGRPRSNVFPGRPGVQNYNITNLPYGDLNYLTSQTSRRDDEEEEEAVLMEPLVEINMDQSEQSRDAETSQNISRVAEEENLIESSRVMEPVIIEPVVQIAEQSVKKEYSEEGNIIHDDVDISEIETKIGLIGECTISVAN